MENLVLADLFERAKKYGDKTFNEAQTINTFVVPFLSAFGYDISEPDSVMQEFPIEVGDRKVEHIDFALFHGQKDPDVFIECKAITVSLDKPQILQLRRYFNIIESCKIGILTNGIRYLFFHDPKNGNNMDLTPFLEVDFATDENKDFSHLKSLSKEVWDLEELKSSSEQIRRYRDIAKVIAKEIDNPSDDFCRYFATLTCPNIRITKNIVDEFKLIVKRSFSEYISAIAHKSLNEAQKKLEEEVNAKIEEANEDPDVITTNTEIMGHTAIKTMLKNVVDPSRIIMRDGKYYCSICLDGRKGLICRLYNFEEQPEGSKSLGKHAYVEINNAMPPERVSVATIEDLYPLKSKLAAVVEKIKNKS